MASRSLAPAVVDTAPGEPAAHLNDAGHATVRAVVSCVMSIISEQNKPLSELIKQYQTYSQSGEINFEVEDKDAKIRELGAAYKSAQIDNLDGITIDNGDWWFNVRKSNTEPLLRLNLEAKTPADVEKRLEELKKILGEPAHGH